jgi:RNA polymerase sigma factor (sigma-70 family)
MEGDEGAWRYTYHYILIICGWKKWNLRDSPEDMAQQILAHLLEKAIKKVKEKEKFRNFIKTMNINKIKDSFKSPLSKMETMERSVRDKNGEEIPVEFADPRPLQEESLMNLEIVSIIDAAIQRLPEPSRRVIQEYLNFKRGLYEDYQELSEVLKMRVPTISSIVSRGIAKLMKMKVNTERGGAPVESSMEREYGKS